MFARISLALIVTLLLIATGERAMNAQAQMMTPAPQQQQQHPCQAQFEPLRTDLQAKGNALQVASKKKMSAKELCARITSYANAEVKMIRFLETKAQECGIPANAADGLKKSRERTNEMKTKICAAAANQTTATPPPPSQGLSGALTTGTGSTPEAPQSGGGIFDTLSGNVLQR